MSSALEGSARCCACEVYFRVSLCTDLSMVVAAALVLDRTHSIVAGLFVVSHHSVVVVQPVVQPRASTALLQLPACNSTSVCLPCTNKRSRYSIVLPSLSRSRSAFALYLCTLHSNKDFARRNTFANKNGAEKQDTAIGCSPPFFPLTFKRSVEHFNHYSLWFSLLIAFPDALLR